jgi:general secretion pathway protein L
MTLQELLNSDVEVIGDWLRQGWDWWIEELAQLIPESWRRGGRGEAPVAELEGSGATVRLWRRGRFVEIERGARPSAAALGVSPELVLTREVVLPAVGRSDVRRLAALDLDRLTPFRPDQVYFDVERVELDRALGRQTLTLAVIPRAAAEAALERGRGYGLTPLRLGVLEEGGLRFDFLPAMRAAGHGGRSDRGLLLWWGAAALLAALNVGILVFKDMDDVGALRAVVEQQRPAAELASSLRRRVETEAVARRALLAQRTHDDPLRIQASVTRAFPPPQWIQRLEWNGRNLRLVGYRDPGFDVLGAIRKAGDLGEPRALTNGTAAAPGAKPAFDLVTQPPGGPKR